MKKIILSIVVATASLNLTIAQNVTKGEVNSPSDWKNVRIERVPESSEDYILIDMVISAADKLFSSSESTTNAVMKRFKMKSAMLGAEVISMMGVNNSMSWINTENVSIPQSTASIAGYAYRSKDKLDLESVNAKFKDKVGTFIPIQTKYILKGKKIKEKSLDFNFFRVYGVEIVDNKVLVDIEHYVEGQKMRNSRGKYVVAFVTDDSICLSDGIGYVSYSVLL